MGMDRECNTGLDLGMGVGVTVIREEENCFQRPDDPPVQLDLLPLGPTPRHCSAPRESLFTPPLFPLSKNSHGSHGHCDGADAGETRSIRQVTVSGREIDVNKLPAACYCDDDAIASSPNSTVSSLKMDANYTNQENTCAISVKRERDNNNIIVSDEYELDRACSRASDEEEEGAGTRKKLRLSKEQSALLEESFKEHSTLNPKQKQALAKQLNLRPRQVEVWFQNRRARTKLKQTEVDCEFLKRCCETLTDENRRLQKELQELRALKMASPFYMQLPAATLTMCPSCERVVTADNNRPFALAKPAQFYPYTHSSAAC